MAARFSKPAQFLHPFQIPLRIDLRTPPGSSAAARGRRCARSIFPGQQSAFERKERNEGDSLSHALLEDAVLLRGAGVQAVVVLDARPPAGRLPQLLRREIGAPELADLALPDEFF